jgi:hypothetical protein
MSNLSAWISFFISLYEYKYYKNILSWNQIFINKCFFNYLSAYKSYMIIFEDFYRRSILCSIIIEEIFSSFKENRSWIMSEKECGTVKAVDCN